MSALTAVTVVACDSGGAGSVDAKRVFPEPKIAELAEAAANGDRNRVRELVQAGAGPNARGDKGVNLLQWALLNKSGAGLEALVESGADPAHPDSSGETVVHYAAKANDSSYLDILLAHGADPAARNRQGATFLRYLDVAPPDILSEDARRQREAIRRWLREHGLPAEDARPAS